VGLTSAENNWTYKELFKNIRDAVPEEGHYHPMLLMADGDAKITQGKSLVDDGST
jgi:hypothetical protein